MSRRPTLGISALVMSCCGLFFWFAPYLGAALGVVAAGFAIAALVHRPRWWGAAALPLGLLAAAANVAFTLAITRLIDGVGTVLNELTGIGDGSSF